MHRSESASPQASAREIHGVLSATSGSQLVQALYDSGPSSRADLARATGLSRASVTGIIQRMLEQNLIFEGPQRSSSVAGGKPSRPLWFSSTGPMLAAAHLLPNSLSVALVTLSGQIVAERTTSIDPHTSNPARCVTKLIADNLKKLRGQCPGTVLGIGIAVGGIVDTTEGRVVRIDLARTFDDAPIGPMVEDATGLRTVIDLHPRAQALGDRWFGLGRGHPSFASVYASEALGVGLVLNGALQRGAAGSGGEIGHSVVQVDGEQCLCGQRGCWETIASHRWLCREAAQYGLPAANDMTAGRLVDLAANDISGAATLLDAYARNLSVGLVNLHQILAPGIFIIHGSVVAGGEAFLTRIRSHFSKRIPPHPSGPPIIIFADNHDSSTLLGAAALVLSAITSSANMVAPRYGFSRSLQDLETDRR